jgi:DNA-binding response OmpR family regulator
VLVVQPREALALATGRHLQAAGFDAVVATDGDTGVRLNSRDRPAAVVIDLTLPVLDGWYVLAALARHRHAPFVIAYSRPGDASRARALGADACVHDRSAVVETVRHLVGV